LLTWIFLILSVLLAIGTFLYLKKVEGGGDNPINPVVPQKQQLPSQRKNSLENLWPVLDITEGIMELPNNRYAAICRIAATDFYLLGDDEQDSIEDAAARAIMALNFPVQIITVSDIVDTRQAIADLEATPPMNDTIGYLRSQRIAYLEAIMQDKQSTVRQSYLVVSTYTTKGRKHAFGEIQHQIAVLLRGLQGAKIKAEILNSEGVVDFLSTLCKPNSTRPSEIIQGGVLSPFHFKEGA